MDYRISTITAIAKLDSLINLGKLYSTINQDDNNKLFYTKSAEDIYLNYVIFVEYGKTKDISNSKGINPKSKKKNTYKKKIKDSKRFDNQLTLIIDLNNNCINMKLFKNGRIQMTGLKNIDNGPIAINIVINIIKNLNLINNDILEKNDIKFSNYKICLINSDFKFTSKLKRNKLFEYLNNGTNLICSYEPCIYPGVKIQFFYNNNFDGVCRCENGFCSNKNKNSECTKITIAVFESGCTIITGAKSLEQINITYKFIKDLLTNNINQFKKIDLDQLLLQ